MKDTAFVQTFQVRKYLVTPATMIMVNVGVPVGIVDKNGEEIILVQRLGNTVMVPGQKPVLCTQDIKNLPMTIRLVSLITPI